MALLALRKASCIGGFQLKLWARSWLNQLSRLCGLLLRSTSPRAGLFLYVAMAFPPVGPMEQTMQDTTIPWETEVAEALLQKYVDEGKISNSDGLKTALVKALGDAYEKGLQDGLTTRQRGPDA
jgi:hypothetical protein